MAVIGVAPITQSVRRDAGHGTRDVCATLFTVLLALVLCTSAHAQVNSGSNGSDGAFNPATNTVINMADHPNGIYQYTSVNISNVVTVTFIPNANNSPVVWLVQSNCVISGQINLDGQSAGPGVGASGGSGGYAGGSGGSVPTPGQGPGGGPAGVSGGGASYGSLGLSTIAGSIYGNAFLLPLIGGSGGGGSGDSGAFTEGSEVEGRRRNTDSSAKHSA